MQKGKGDNPRNCFSRQFKDNYETINWSKKNPAKESEQEAGETEQRVLKDQQGSLSRESPYLPGMR